MKVAVWLDKVTGNNEFEFLYPAVNVLAGMYDVNVIGVIAPPNIKFNKLPALNEEDLKNVDLILVTGHEINFYSILKQAEQLNIDSDKIVMDKTVCIPKFTLEKYKKLRHSQLSILSMNCWGGMTYNKFGLQFLSPTINMYTSEKDFLKFLKNPMQNVKKNLRLQSMEFNESLNFKYPVFKIGESEWHMNHYNNVSVARDKWIERTRRINWFNLLVMMYTENHEVLEEFDKLPYSKKICFVPFKTDIESGYYLNLSILENAELWKAVNSTKDGSVYDMWDMLLYGKKTLLIKQ